MDDFEPLPCQLTETPGQEWRNRPPTLKQKQFFNRYRSWRYGMTRGEASDLIGEMLYNESICRGYLLTVKRTAVDRS